MFGYIRIYKDEMKVREFNCFRSYYCGLCKSIKRRYGFAARFALSYDVAFLAVLLCAIGESESDVRAERCVVSPFAKRAVVRENEYLDYCATVNVLMSYCKLRDDWHDDRSIRAALAIPFFRPRRLRKRCGPLYGEATDALAQLSALEERDCDVPDEAAHAFGVLMEAVFDWRGADDGTRRILRHMGYSLGRFIYLLDAFADREEDRARRRYNAYNLRYPEMTDDDRAQIRASLEYTLTELSHSYELLPIRQNKPILDNIIYLGLPDSLKRVMEGRFEPPKKTKEKTI